MSKILAFGIAVIFSFILFAGMHFLIDGEVSAKPIDSKTITIVTVTPDDLNPKKWERKTPPPPPEFKPMAEQPALADRPQNVPKPHLIKVAKRPDLTSGESLFGNLGAKDFMHSGSSVGLAGEGLAGEGLAPKVRIEPHYPIKAASKEIEGHVVLKFDINHLGETVNIRILEAKPKGYFEKASRKALRKWMYKVEPKKGKTVAASDQIVTLNFQLEKSQSL